MQQIYKTTKRGSYKKPTIDELYDADAAFPEIRNLEGIQIRRDGEVDLRHEAMRYLRTFIKWALRQTAELIELILDSLDELMYGKHTQQ